MQNAACRSTYYNYLFIALIDWTNQPTNQLNRLMDWLINGLADWFDWLKSGWLAGWLAGQIDRFLSEAPKENISQGCHKVLK